MNRIQNTKGGFTLIELLVVISIIGMLSSVVLVALQGARAKGAVAANITFATNMRDALYNASSPQSQASFSFNEGSGTSVADDFGANGLTLVPGAGSSMWLQSNLTPTGSGSAVTFNNTYSQYAAFNSSLTIGSSITVAYWLNTTATDGAVFSTRNGGVNIFLGYTGGNLYAYSNGPFIPTYPINDGKWHYITWTATTGVGAKQSFYVDGKLIASDTAHQYTPATSVATYLGRDINGFNPPYMTGSLDDFRIFGQAITDAQVHELFAQSAPSHGITLADSR